MVYNITMLAKFIFIQRLLVIALILVSPSAIAQGKIDFNRDVRPIISGTCLKCHGIDENARKGKLRLDLRDAALGAGKSGEIAIVPGKPDQSEIIRRIFSDDDEDIMPPTSAKMTITKEQKATLKQWVAEGAEYKTHWAWVAPKQAPMPTVKSADWVRNPVDAYVLAKLEAAQLRPAPEADKNTLIRRLSLDLIGLPPTLEEADAFINDPSPNAYEKAVERLLASPHYGERWARRWLDLARYADTNGFEKDRPRQIWPYRNWVINAMNADMPFDQFTIKQIAGDLLPNATVDDRIATGFHRNTMRNEEGGIDPLEYRFYSMVDRVGTTGTAWLGLTLTCAQCHTHKYDPITHTDYYRVMAFMNNCNEPEMPLPLDANQLAKKTALEKKIARLTGELPDQWPVGETQTQTPIAKVTTANGAVPKPAKDGSIEFTGPNAATETYTFTFDTSLASIDRIKLEVISDGKKKRPGRTAHGNFVLTDITATVAPADHSEQSQPVKFSRADADHSQESFNVSAAIDGDKKTGWGVAPEYTKTHTATFYLEKPLKLAQGAHWIVKLDQQYGNQHTIAQCRLSVAGPSEKVKDISVADQKKKLFEKAFAAWEAGASKQAISWKPIRPMTLKSNSPTLTLLDDDSVLASGDITKSDLFDLTFADLPVGVTAIRLEALPHESLPKNGPGMIDHEGPPGDFSLSNISLTADGTEAKFVNARQDFAAGGNTAMTAIDANLQTGWMINGGQGKPHYAIFVLASPTTTGKNIQIKMFFEKYYAATLGHFRISITTDPRANTTEPMNPAAEAALLTVAASRTAEQTADLRTHFANIVPELAAARNEIEVLRGQIPQPQTTLVLVERPAEHTRTTNLYHRGEFLQPKEQVQPGIPGFLPPIPKGTAENRLVFAQWLVSPENPLTARVQVNRRWAAFFGRGIVRTTEDFGFQGELPANQELLDYLAVEFVRQGWSTRKLDKLIVMSNTYRQSSRITPELLELDPQNVLQSRGPRVRLEAELVRDSALRAAGLLSETIGGPSVFPPQPASVTTEGTYGAFAWNASTGEARFRRSLYTFSKRTAPFALYGTFDGPTGEACVARREISNTPLQALSLLNDTIFIEAAQALGKNTTTVAGNDEAKAASIFRHCLTRSPSNDELTALVKFASQQRTRLINKELDAVKIAGDGTGNVTGDAIERATWSLVARAVLNLDEMVTKN